MSPCQSRHFRGHDLRSMVIREIDRRATVPFRIASHFHSWLRFLYKLIESILIWITLQVRF